jgi:TetR/AcrR family transcriptional repressor of nem operon
MARPKAFDTQQALDAAVRTFWAGGYESTSIQDLVEALGINRASLYGTFGDKAQLFSAAIDRYGEQVRAALSEKLAPPHAGREAVAGYLAAVADVVCRPGKPAGCLLINTAVGCTSAPPQLLQRAYTAVLQTESALLAALRRDKALAKRKDLRAVARFFAAQSHGLAVLARAGARPAQLREAAAVALRVLDAPQPARDG